MIPFRHVDGEIWEKVAAPEDIGAVREIAEMTDEVLRREREELTWLTPEDRASGAGCDYLMEPFIYKNPEGSRFSDGSFGVYYAARSLATAIEESKYHRQDFMSRTRERPMRLEMRAVAADLEGTLHDIRGLRQRQPRVYSPTTYTASQVLARRLFGQSSEGISYDSVRDRGGECAAVFKPNCLSRCRLGKDMVFEWDGIRISRVYEFREFLS